MTTPVIFRKFKDGDILALFPTLPGTNNTYADCLSYQRIGQHGAADIVLCLKKTVLAKPEEYKPLYDELVSIGYDDLKVYSKRQQGWAMERHFALTEGLK
jgi:hypothetical protein